MSYRSTCSFLHSGSAVKTKRYAYNWILLKSKNASQRIYLSKKELFVFKNSIYVFFSVFYLQFNIQDTVEDDMDHPLSHYFIASSHNTYLTGKVHSYSSSTPTLQYSLEIDEKLALTRTALTCTALLTPPALTCTVPTHTSSHHMHRTPSHSRPHLHRPHSNFPPTFFFFFINNSSTKLAMYEQKEGEWVYLSFY